MVPLNCPLHLGRLGVWFAYIHNKFFNSAELASSPLQLCLHLQPWLQQIGAELVFPESPLLVLAPEKFLLDVPM